MRNNRDRAIIHTATWIEWVSRSFNTMGDYAFSLEAVQGYLIVGTLGAIAYRAGGIHVPRGDDLTRVMGDHAHVWLSPVSSLIIASAGNFFVRGRENRERSWAQFYRQEQHYIDEMNTCRTAGEKAMESQQYHLALQNFTASKAAYSHIYRTDNRLRAKQLYLDCVYKESLALFCLKRHEEIQQNLSNVLESPDFHEDSHEKVLLLNLRGLIAFQEGCLPEKIVEGESARLWKGAKHDFEASFKIDKSQNSVYLFLQYLMGKYQFIAQNIPIICFAPHINLTLNQSSIMQDTILNICANACSRIGDWSRAICLYETHLSAATPNPILFFELAQAHLQCLKAYCALIDSKNAQDNVSLLKLVENPQEQATTSYKLVTEKVSINKLKPIIKLHATKVKEYLDAEILSLEGVKKKINHAILYADLLECINALMQNIDWKETAESIQSSVYDMLEKLQREGFQLTEAPRALKTVQHVLRLTDNLGGSIANTPNQLIICRTKGEGDCAFHAALGEHNQGIFEHKDPASSRVALVNMVKFVLDPSIAAQEGFLETLVSVELITQRREELLHYIRLDLAEHIADGWDMDKKGVARSHPKMKELITKYKTVAIMANGAAHPIFSRVVEDQDVMKVYIDYLAQPGNYLTSHVFGLIAICFDVTICFYQTVNPGRDNEHINTLEPFVFKSQSERDIRKIRHDGFGHYERMLSDEEIKHSQVIKKEGREASEIDFSDIQNALNIFIKQYIDMTQESSPTSLVGERIAGFCQDRDRREIILSSDPKHYIDQYRSSASLSDIKENEIAMKFGESIATFLNHYIMALQRLKQFKKMQIAINLLLNEEYPTLEYCDQVEKALLETLDGLDLLAARTQNIIPAEKEYAFIHFLRGYNLLQRENFEKNPENMNLAYKELKKAHISATESQDKKLQQFCVMYLAEICYISPDERRREEFTTLWKKELYANSNISKACWYNIDEAVKMLLRLFEGTYEYVSVEKKQNHIQQLVNFNQYYLLEQRSNSSSEPQHHEKFWVIFCQFLQGISWLTTRFEGNERLVNAPGDRDDKARKARDKFVECCKSMKAYGYNEKYISRKKDDIFCVFIGNMRLFLQCALKKLYKGEFTIEGQLDNRLCELGLISDTYRSGSQWPRLYQSTNSTGTSSHTSSQEYRK